MDSHDRAILAALQHEGRIANVQLAERVHLSESACLRRVRALESAGMIQGYSARVDPQKVGLSGIVFVSITLERQDQDELQVFEDAVRAVPEVMDCYLMTGELSSNLLKNGISTCPDSCPRAWTPCSRRT